MKIAVGPVDMETKMTTDAGNRVVTRLHLPKNGIWYVTVEVNGAQVAAYPTMHRETAEVAFDIAVSSAVKKAKEQMA